MTKVYLDSDVWLNLWQQEMLGFNPAFLRAEQLLDRVSEKGWKLVVSDLVKKEVVQKGVLEEHFEEKINSLREKGLVEDMNIAEADMDEAKEISKNRHIHMSDALHTALARRSGATIVTRNIRHFRKVRGLVTVRKPEELLM